MISKISNKRCPIITIMGHVDHGKTSILNKLLSLNIIEYKNITQNISIYNIDTNYGNMTFIDTPGHNSFINMREKGAKITDLLILVISIDDGIKDQTIESIKYIKNFNIPTIIVINKIDKGYHNLNTIKNDLFKNDILIQELGGNYNLIFVSAKSGFGIDDLLKEIYKKSKFLDLNIVYDLSKINAFIIESSINQKKGIMLYMLIKNGCLKIGNFIVCGNQYGKIKFMHDKFNKNIYCSTPSIPLYVFALSKIPELDYNIFITENLKEAKILSKNNLKKKNNYIENIKNNKYTLDNLKYELYNNKNKNLSNLKYNYIFKTKTYESYIVLKESINLIIKKYEFFKIINFNIGDINTNDINLSFNSNSKLIGLNIKANNKELNLINKMSIFFKNFLSIFELIDFLNNDLNKIYLNQSKNNFSKGYAIIYNIYVNLKKKSIIGCKIISGRIKNNSSIQILRENELIYTGQIYSLRCLKNNIIEAKSGTECGIMIKGNFTFKKNDIIMSN